jgi:hypothetical protein
VSSGFAGVEHFIIETLPDVLSMGGFDRWFFLRFLDDDGLHVRLRLRADGDAHDLSGRVSERVKRGVMAAEQASVGIYRPAIMPPPAMAAPYVECRRALDERVVRDVYVPEVEKFGHEGIDAAELMFQISSEVGLAILRSERDGSCDRKAVALVLMHEMWRALGSPGGVAFWDGYAGYWLDPIPGLMDRWRPRFLTKAANLAAAGLSLLNVAGAGAVLCADFADRVRPVAMRMIAAGLPAAELAFHFMHLTNNRLGVMPIEEAYFATMIGTVIAKDVL